MRWMRLYGVLGVMIVTATAAFAMAEKPWVQLPPDQLGKPPIGRWGAVYSADFAEKYRLPVEGVVSDMPAQVDYMELDTLEGPSWVKGPMCFVNFLVKRPNDYAFHPKTWWGGDKVRVAYVEYNHLRKLLHLVPYQYPINGLRGVNTFEVIFDDNDDYPDYYWSGESMLTAFYSAEVLDGYDYITGEYDCNRTAVTLLNGRVGVGIRVQKASVWGKWETKYPAQNSEGRPQDEDYRRSFISVVIPPQLIRKIWNDVTLQVER